MLLPHCYTLFAGGKLEEQHNAVVVKVLLEGDYGIKVLNWESLCCHTWLLVVSLVLWHECDDFEGEYPLDPAKDLIGMRVKWPSKWS